MSKKIDDTTWIDDDVHAVEQITVNGKKYWVFPVATVNTSERISYGYAASKKRHPQNDGDIDFQVDAPGSPMVLAEPFDQLVTDGVDVDEIAADIVAAGGTAPYYIEDTVFGWIGYKSDYAELANAYGLDPDDYEGPGVYDLRDLTREHKTIDEYDDSSAEFWVNDTLEYLAQSSDEEAREMMNEIIDGLGGDPDDVEEPDKEEPVKPPPRRKGRGFEFLN